MRLICVGLTAILLAACSPAASGPETGDVTPLAETAADKAGIDLPEPAGPVLDPSALDLSDIAIAMRIPSAFVARDEGAYLQIYVLSPRLGVEIEEEFPLVLAEGVASAFLAAEAKPGFSIWAYETRPEDAARLTAISTELARLKAEAPGENELSFGAVAPGCWNETERTPESLRRTLYLRVVPEADFELFVPEQEIGQGDLPGHESFWAPCEG